MALSTLDAARPDGANIISVPVAPRSKWHRKAVFTSIQIRSELMALQKLPLLNSNCGALEFERCSEMLATIAFSLLAALKGAKRDPSQLVK